MYIIQIEKNNGKGKCRVYTGLKIMSARLPCWRGDKVKEENNLEIFVLRNIASFLKCFFVLKYYYIIALYA